MDRRRFLKALGAGAGLVAGSGLVRPRRAMAAPWGAFPVAAQQAMLPEGVAAKSVLEIFLYGGLCPWETFYVVPEYGTANNEQWNTFQSGSQSVSNVVSACGALGQMPMLEPFGTDALGTQVQLGPFIAPLRRRSDIIDRMRTFVMHHELEPHEAAIPLAVSGRGLGNPKLSGPASAFNHYHQVRSPLAVPAPFAYVLFPVDAFPTDNLQAASAVGFMPASSRPLSVKLEANSTLGQTLARDTVGPIRAEYDALVKQYTLQYVNRYKRPGAQTAVRAPALSDYRFASGTLQETEILEDIFTPDVLAPQSGSSCGDSANLDTPGMGLRIAAYLLTRPTDAPRYVQVFDGGLIPASGGGGYDTHTAHNTDSLRNLNHTLSRLVSIINEPGEKDPDKIDLDDTLVILNTEFGRTPYAQNGDGRNHHPYGYTTVMFGGPIGAAQKGIYGAIGADSIASTYLTPAEFRAAVQMAANVWPFESETFAVGDIQAGNPDIDNEMAAALWLKSDVLGQGS